MHLGLKGRSPNIAKGAFGPSYAGQDNPDQDAGDAQNSVEVAPRRQKKRLVKRARALDEDINSSSTRTCEACGLASHLITNCYYVFPEKAPQWFTENPEIRSAVDELLKSDAALRDEVRRLKTKRAKSTERAKSTSSNRSNSANRSNTRNRSREPKVIEEEDD